MSNIKKLMMSAAGGEALNVEDVFSTYLYTGDSTNSRQITNGIDLSGEGGMVITAPRSNGNVWSVADSERGATSWLYTNGANAEQTGQDRYGTFNSDGYTMGSSSANGYMNFTGYTYVSWTFRKAPKFFDVVTYTGNGTAGRTVSHNLNSVPGCIFIKRTSSAEDWVVYHRGADATSPEDYYFKLNTTAARIDSTAAFNDTAPTSTQFTLGNNGDVNASSETYVAYLFAHNDGDGDFGPTGDQDIIKCGSWTASSTSAVSVDLGFEPQWVLVKRASGTQSWLLWDTMRGMPVDSGQPYLQPNSSSAESTDTYYLSPTPTGFTVRQNALGSNGDTYIYIAIRRGPMAVPTDATDVFHIDDQSTSISEAPRYRSGFVTDFYLWKEKHTSTDWTASTRLLGTNILKPNLTNAQTSSSLYTWDFMEGALNVTSVDANKPAWMWRRAPNFFDVVAYTGNGAERNITHNLGVTPEMIWVKQRSGTKEWFVYHKDLTSGKVLQLESAAAETNGDYGSITDTTFGTNASANLNGSGSTYIAYLFASLDGVSKVGSYTGNGTNQNIDCGFSSGARFVLVKAINTTSNWQLAGDFENGIVAGSDSLLRLDLSNAVVNFDFIDPYSGGFNVTGAQLNTSGTEYTFYAIA